MQITILLTVLGLLIIFLAIQYSFLIPAPRGIVVLMYHKVSDRISDDLTVTTAQLERQFSHIRDTRRNVISFSDLKRHTAGEAALPENPVIITFDDGFLNNYDLAYPILRKFGFRAAFFFPVAYIGKTNAWDNGDEPIMDYETVRRLSESDLADIGLHSYSHTSYEKLSAEEIEKDILKSITALKEKGVTHINVLAYPYGKYPRKDKDRNAALKNILKKSGIDFALRIGSKVNRLPIKDPYEMTRTNIKGSETFTVFKIKLKKGRSKLF